VPISVLLVCAGLMLSRTAVSAIPVAGSAAADLFTAHKWSARLIVRAIEKRLAGPVEPVRTPWWRRRSSLA
jgi:hypothetical protein